MKKTALSIAILMAVIAVFSLSSCSGNKGEKLSALFVEGQKLECHMNMKDALDALKDYEYEYSDSISCAYNGLDKIYDYTDSGFCVYTYPVEGEDFILEVVVSSPEIKQLDGKVYVGMTMDDVVALFGEDYSKEGDIISYTVKDKQTMYFLVEDGAVIEYAISVAE